MSGEDEAGEPRVLEIPDHPFFVATLFVPGASYFEGVVKAEGAHPLVKALLRAGLSFRAGQSLEAAGGRS